jgi:hypothetical protein
VISAPPPASSAQVRATLTIRPGPLLMSVKGVSVTVTDARGSGQGWAVDASVVRGSAALEGFSEQCAAGSTCSLPVSPLRYPAQVTAVSAPVLEAQPGTGMGTILYSLNWSASSVAVIALEISSGP